MCRRSVLLPDPLGPMITKMSSGSTAKLRSRWMTRSPYIMSRSRTSMRDLIPVATSTVAIVPASQMEEVEEDGHHRVRDDDEHDPGDHRRRRGGAHRRRGSPGLHSAQAARDRHEHAEHRGLDESRREVVQRDGPEASSRVMATLTRSATYACAPNARSCTAPTYARITPTRKVISETIGSACAPASCTTSSSSDR